MRALVYLIAAIMLLATTVAAQDGVAHLTAREGIDAGNRAWINGVKSDDVTLIAATYAEDAVDCSASGECIKRRRQIERRMRTQLATFGRARSAGVKTSGSTQQGNFVYEWGRQRRSLMAASAWWKDI